MQKKLFKHGGSYAVDLPISFVRDLPSKTVVVEEDSEKIMITPKREFDTIEHEPEFKAFIAALLHDAMKRPERLRGVKEVWDKEWEELLKGVPRGED